MAGDRHISADAKTLLNSETRAEWWRDNVWNAMVNGSGVLQVYNTFAEKPVALPEVPQAETGSRDWMIHTFAEVGGAILPYVAMGKLTGCALKGAGTRFGATGFASRMLANESAAMVLGAGVYDFTKAPREGETRLGNSLGAMATFTVFESGNAGLKYVTNSMNAGASVAKGSSRMLLGLESGTVTKALVVGTGRGVVGAVGGFAGFASSHYVSELQGEKNTTTSKQMWDSIASGGFLNIALPVVHKGVTRLAESAIKPQFTMSIISESTARKHGLIPDVSAVREISGEKKVARFFVEPEPPVADAARNRGDLAMWDAREPGPHSPEASLTSSAPGKSRRAGGTDGTSNEGSLPDGTQVPTEGNLARTLQRDKSAPSPSDGTSTSVQGEQSRPKEGDSPQSQTPEARKGQLVPLDRNAWGSAEPLGATVTEQGINFAVSSKGATRIDLLLFADPAATVPSQVLPLFKTGDVHHRFVPEQKPGTLYLYRAHGPYQPAVDGTRFNSNKTLIDPYSKAVTGDTAGDRLGYDNSNPSDARRDLRPSTTDNVAEMPKSVAVKLGEFDWQGDRPPAIPMTDTIIYEAGLRAFTATDPSVTPNHRGTYRGLIEKIPYLKKLGVTAVELLPIMKFDKADWPHIDPETGQPLGNAWGYNTVAFQAPEGRFAADGTRGQQVAEFQHMVKELHNANIEVILDIVFNHTRESDKFGTTVSFKGLDNNVYYLLTPGDPAKYVNHTGCGNTMNCNHPVVQKLILDTLRYWKTEMHVDGFRFDLASIFNYDVNGVEQAKTPIIEAIHNDPVLKDVKLIAEAWSPANYRLGKFADKRWAEWNGDFRDLARKFIKGEEGQTATLADRIAGSPGWFDASKGRYSINFITAHDGFTMRDLVSFNEKHNLRNGEKNADGTNDNFSWNCGHEGPVEHAPLNDAQKAAIEQLRTQQQKNLLTMLFLSRGTPMLLYGDEIRRTQQGNNNSWPVEPLNNMDWASLAKNADMLRFTEMMIELRKRQEIGRLSPQSLIWHGTEPLKPDFSNGARFIAWEYQPNAGKPPLYTAFNAYWEPLKLRLPTGQWRRLVDTGLPSGQDIVKPEAGTPLGTEYIIQPRTSIVLEGKPKDK